MPQIPDPAFDWPGGHRVFHRVGVHVTAGEGPTDFNIDEFTREVGISPTFQRKKNLGKRLPFTTWVYELEEREEVMTEILLKELMDKLEGRGSRWVEAMTSQNLYATVIAVIEIRGRVDRSSELDIRTPAFSFNLDTLGRLKELGCGLELDMYYCDES